KFLSILFIIFMISSCKTASDKTDGGLTDYKYNFIITASDSDIDHPDRDRISFYVVYIDKVEAGRTTTGLESQDKYFEANLTENKHLITLEKWVLDKNKGRYVKLNNIEQPKPGFIYITIEKGKQTRIKMRSANNGVAAYTSETE
ncbi:MAG TPA: hypothetical protein PK986_10815, partial [Spirochaetota bacterium]|nr:hypothetical protein [Spirochaetota bacterium]